MPCSAGATVAEQPPAEAGERGGLVIHDKAVQRIAEHTAAHTPGVLRHSAGLNRLTGRTLPRVATHIAGGHVRAHIDVAVAWPQPLAQVTAAVRAQVSEALHTLTGLVVDAVDVAAPTVLLPGTPDTGRRVQ